MTKNILIYDIETSPLQAWIWRLGEQTVRHDQLVTNHSNYDILTISYKWFNSSRIYCLDYTDPNMIEKFDMEVRKADLTIGKNSDQFDVKHINTQRMLAGLRPLPEWMDTKDDLEKQLRRHFVFPSQSLDYISNLLGYGGKQRMEFQDWKDIVESRTLERLAASLKKPDLMKLSIDLFGVDSDKLKAKGANALKKMIRYNKKDVEDTYNILKKVLPYIKLKYNAATHNDGKGCIECGSTSLLPTKIIIKGQTKYQLFECGRHCNPDGSPGYAGKATIRYDKNRNKRFGRMC